MAIDGTYAFVYSGSTGVGIGGFTIRDGALVGRDYGGGEYEGSATETQGGIEVSISLRVPAGGWLVTGASAQDIPTRREFTVMTPPAFGDGEPFKLRVPPGEVWVIVRRVPDTYADTFEGDEGLSADVGRTLGHPEVREEGA